MPDIATLKNRQARLASFPEALLKLINGKDLGKLVLEVAST